MAGLCAESEEPMAVLTTDKAKGGGVAMGQPDATNRLERMSH